MKNYRRVFRSILLVAAGVLCLLCASTMWTLNESFASGTAEVACSPNSFCGLIDIETGDVTFWGMCTQWFTGCYCYGYTIENGKPVGEPWGENMEVCDM